MAEITENSYPLNMTTPNYSFLDRFPSVCLPRSNVLHLWILSQHANASQYQIGKQHTISGRIHATLGKRGICSACFRVTVFRSGSNNDFITPNCV